MGQKFISKITFAVKVKVQRKEKKTNATSIRKERNGYNKLHAKHIMPKNMIHTNTMASYKYVYLLHAVLNMKINRQLLIACSV